MAIKTVTCFVCGEEVSKRNSLFIEGKGRGCKTHPEVVEESNILLQLEKEQRQKNIEKVQNKKDIPIRPRGDFDFKLRCWACEKEGVQSQEHSLKVLAAMGKEKEVNTSYNIFDMSFLKKYLSEVELTPLYVLNNDLPEVKRVTLKRQFVQPMLLSNFKVLCGKCILNNNLQHLVAPSVEQLRNFMNSGVTDLVMENVRQNADKILEK